MDWRDRPRCDETPAWALLQAHAERFAADARGRRGFDLRQAFAEEPQRAARLSVDAPHVFADLSKNLIDGQARALLLQLAHECGLTAHRDALLSGALVNTSEQRAATHVQWRSNGKMLSALDGSRSSAPETRVNQVCEAQRVPGEMLAFAEAVRRDGAFTDVVNLGIGGSDLGPRMVVQALRSSGHVQAPKVHFVANMDGHELAALLPRLNVQTTLFLIASKTFGTAETMQNARSARDWFFAQGGADMARHFVALSANAGAAQAFGASRCFGFDEGLGGRFSLWSSVGLSIAIAAGSQAFAALRAGAHAMDLHFASAPFASNLPVQLGLLDVWYRNMLGFGSRCVVPYHHGLRRLPAYLQQLEMESNGKRVDARGRALPFDTAPVIWGEAGTNGQHAFFQMLHQGTQTVPVEFVAVREPAHALPDHHDKLLANALAQARALMLGDAGDAPERDFPGNRPSTFLLLDRLNPESLGALLALYEHRVFVSGSLWGINSFDQWGVELGKRHAGPIEQALAQVNHGDQPPYDPSTIALIRRLMRG